MRKAQSRDTSRYSIALVGILACLVCACALMRPAAAVEATISSGPPAIASSSVTLTPATLLSTPQQVFPVGVAQASLPALNALASTAPPQPDVAPLIGKTYAEDGNGNKLHDVLDSRVEMLSAAVAIANAEGQAAVAKALGAEMVDVELIFDTQITQAQIQAFLDLGGEITYIYQAVSYGWNGRVPLGNVDQLSAAMGGALVFVGRPVALQRHMRLATQTGRARPVWVNGFAGSATGYNGDSNTSIAILDTGVDDAHTDLTGRQAFWYDYTTDGEANPIDIGHHGTHVTGIALGSGASMGTGTTLNFSQGFDYSGVSTNSFYPSPFEHPGGSGNWTIYGIYNGGGTASLYMGIATAGTASWGALAGGSGYASGAGFSISSYTFLTTSMYSPILLQNGTMTNAGTLNIVTGFSAVGDGFNTLSGVAPGCQWVGAKVFENTGSGHTGYFGSAIDDMVVKRATYNIKVMNLSLGVTGAPGINTTTRQKINTAAGNGILAVISAGNDGPGATNTTSCDDPGRAAMALTIGASNDINELTKYSSNGFTAPVSTAGQEEDYKPDVMAPGGSDYYSHLMSVDSGDADADNGFADWQANDYTGMKGTSMASPFAAGCAALVIDALQTKSKLTGGSSTWDHSSSNDARLVKMLLCATASESNANREASAGSDPTLQRAAAGPSGWPAGKDMFEGYGMINPDAAIEGGTVAYTVGATVGDTLGGAVTSKRVWARRVSLTAGQTFSASLTVPGTGDFDLYLYSLTPSAYGTPTTFLSSTTSGVGNDETISGDPSSSMDAMLVVKSISGSGTFSLTSGYSPLLITLTSLTASAPAFGQPVDVEWATATEINNVGFNVYRAVPIDAFNFEKGELLNATPIPPQGSPTQGAEYTFVDTQPLAQGEDRWYYLEDIDLGGTRTLNGPVKAIVPAGIGSGGKPSGRWIVY